MPWQAAAPSSGRPISSPRVLRVISHVVSALPLLLFAALLGAAYWAGTEPSGIGDGGDGSGAAARRRWVPVRQQQEERTVATVVIPQGRLMSVGDGGRGTEEEGRSVGVASSLLSRMLGGSKTQDGVTSIGGGAGTEGAGGRGLDGGAAGGNGGAALLSGSGSMGSAGNSGRLPAQAASVATGPHDPAKTLDTFTSQRISIPWARKRNKLQRGSATAALSARYMIPQAHHAASQHSVQTRQRQHQEQRRQQQQQGQASQTASAPNQQQQQGNSFVRKSALPAGSLPHVIVPTAAPSFPKPPRPPPPVQLSRRCPVGGFAGSEAAATAAAFGYHLVILASPRVHQGRYLATTLVSVAAADAQPTTMTVLWADHKQSTKKESRRQLQQQQQRLTQPQEQQRQQRNATASGGRGGGDAGAGAGAGAEVEVELVQRVEMPAITKVAPRPAAAAAAAAALAPAAVSAATPAAAPSGGGGGSGNHAADDDDDDAFSLLANLAMYSRHGGITPHHQPLTEQQQHNRTHTAQQQPQSLLQSPAEPFPHLRVRYLPPSVRAGDVLASYYQVFLVPDQIAEELGDPALRRLPLLVLEGDVLLAPRFGERMSCVLRMMQDLAGGSIGSSSGSGGGSMIYSGPDFAASLYDPGMVPKDVPEVIAIYEEAQSKAEAAAKAAVRAEVEKRAKAAAATLAAEKLARVETEAKAKAAVSKAAVMQEALQSLSQAQAKVEAAAAAEAKAAVKAKGQEAGAGAETKAPAGGAAAQQQVYLQAGAGAGGVVEDGLARNARSLSGSSGSEQSRSLQATAVDTSISAATFPLTLVPSLWSWGSQGLLYSYGTRLSLMAHYRDIMSGCAPQDGLQDIELVRHMETRGCAGIPPLPPVRAKPSVTGPACDPRVVHGDRFNETIQVRAAAATAATAAALEAAAERATGRGGGSGSGRGVGASCYLFTARPAMVQHVGAASALFGSVSKRFHMALTFPERVAIPGMDADKAW